MTQPHPAPDAEAARDARSAAEDEAFALSGLSPGPTPDDRVAPAAVEGPESVETAREDRPERINLPGGWYFERIADDGMSYRLRDPARGNHGSWFYTDVDAFAAALNSGTAGVPAGVRPEIAAFALLMERELRANDHKPGWKSDSPEALMGRVWDEAVELEGVVYDRDLALAGEQRRLVIASEAADVANMAMMVADVCGCLAAPNPAPTAGSARTTPAPVEIDYTNYRGERGVRPVIPTGRLLPGDDTYHPGARWVIEAFDVEKDAMRTFDPAHIHRWGDQEPRSSVKVFREVLAGAKEALASTGLSAGSDGTAGIPVGEEMTLSDWLNAILGWLEAGNIALATAKIEELAAREAGSAGAGEVEGLASLARKAIDANFEAASHRIVPDSDQDEEWQERSRFAQAAENRLFRAIAALQTEREQLALAICGGEDAPGYAASLTLVDLKRVIADRLTTKEWTDTQIAELDRSRARDEVDRRVDDEGLTLAERLDIEEAEFIETVSNAYDENGPGIMPGDVEGMFHRIRDTAGLNDAPTTPAPRSDLAGRTE